MTMNHMVNALTSLSRRGRHNIQKVICLALGLAVSAVLITELNFNQSYDTWFPAWDRTYIIKERLTRADENVPTDYWSTPGAIAPGIKRYAPMVEAATRTTDIGSGIQCKLDAEHSIEADIMAADSSFFDLFPVPILSGNPHEVLDQPLCCMVSRSVAETLGGDVMDKKFTVAEYGSTSFKVGGVFEDFPWNSSFHGTQIILSMATLHKGSTENWMGNDRYRSYIRLSEGHAAEEIQPYAQKMMEENVNMDEVRSAGMDFQLVPYLLTEMHTHDEHVRTMNWILGIMAVVLLSISILNYLLITLGNMVGRSTEMAVRKCFGAGKTDIAAITLSESLVHVTLAVILSASLLFACRGSIESYLSAPLSALVCNKGSWMLVALCLLIVLFGAVVPGWSYGRVPVAVVFRGYARNRRRWKLGLLAVQFCIVGLFANLLYTIQAQYCFMTNLNPGYDCHDVAILEVQGASDTEKKKLLQELSRMPQVQAVSSACTIPLEQYGVSGDDVLLPGSDQNRFNATDLYDVTDNYLDVMGIRLLEGTFFTECSDSCNQILVSESLALKISKMAGWKDGVLGKRVRVTGHSGEAYYSGMAVVGIFPDIKIGGYFTTDTQLKERPQFITYSTSMQEYMLLRLSHLTAGGMNEILQRAEEMMPGRLVRLKSWDAEKRSQYHRELSFRNAIALCVAVTMGIALFGLLGYSADEVNRRSKEMAVRKVNGAGMKDILSLFLADVMRVAVPSIIVGAGLSWCIARMWLTSFSHKTALSPWPYLLASALVLSVITISVVLNCRRVAQDNPVRYLKDE